MTDFLFPVSLSSIYNENLDLGGWIIVNLLQFSV
jgi:hypothetical protein